MSPRSNGRLNVGYSSLDICLLIHNSDFVPELPFPNWHLLVVYQYVLDFVCIVEKNTTKCVFADMKKMIIKKQKF